MIAVILTVHILVVAALIVVVLLQRSEGGALFSGGGFMTGRGTANALTRMTSGLAAVFFLTSLGLAWIASHKPKDASLIEQIKEQGGAAPVKPGEATSTDLLRSLGSGQTPPAGAAAPAPGQAAPSTNAPATPPTDAEILDQQPAAPAQSEPAPSPPAPQRG
ncbi:MAG: preprotein translocase subunit SecG, partial [Parvularculaceae bacterium]|nr:preprotein translocase subunit SecG [Parvularculaceae bacterium]